MKGKSILLAVCILIAAVLVCTTIYFFHTQGQFSFLMFYGAWVIAVFGILRFYRMDKSDTHGEEHHHDGSLARDAHH